MWYIYVVECRDGSLYCGISKNVSARVSRHNTGKGSKYTASRRPVKLSSFVPVSECKSDALRAEHKFKKLGREKKLFYLQSGLDSFLQENVQVHTNDDCVNSCTNAKCKNGISAIPQSL